MAVNDPAYLRECIEDVFRRNPAKVVLSMPQNPDEKTFKRIALSKKTDFYQAEKYTKTQVFHENLPLSDAPEYCAKLMESGYRQLNGLAEGRDFMLKISKKGEAFYSSFAVKTAPAEEKNASDTHDRQKNYIISEGTQVPPLVDMGVFTPEGRVVKAMYSKYRQINRFLEVIGDSLDSWDAQKTLRVLDFGCGKSYLTFVLYHYLTEIRGLDVEITGLDLKSDVIERCAAAVEKYGYKKLTFAAGDIAGYTAAADMVVCLHACDTATDLALAAAVDMGARYIYAVPCCQHEINGQIKSERFAALTKNGVIKERFSALITDSVRACLLEAAGYKTQVMEFIDLEHTPKNILIRAQKANIPAEKRRRCQNEANALVEEFLLNPTLLRLLKKQGALPKSADEK